MTRIGTRFHLLKQISGRPYRNLDRTGLLARVRYALFDHLLQPLDVRALHVIPLEAGSQLNVLMRHDAEIVFGGPEEPHFPPTYRQLRARRP